MHKHSESAEPSSATHKGVESDDAVEHAATIDVDAGVKGGVPVEPGDGKTGRRN